MTNLYSASTSKVSNKLRLVRNFRAMFKGQHLPLAFIDLDLVDRNAVDLMARSGGMPIRVASKSLRCVAAIKHVLEHHAGFQGVLAYSAGEAAYLAKNGIDDIVVAYPTVDQADIEGIIPHLKKGKYICLMVDSKAQVAIVNRIAKKNDTIIPLAFDIDLSSKFPFLHFGVHRSPLRKAKQVEELYKHIRTLNHVRLDGVMGYEAQIAGLPDAIPTQKLKSLVIRNLKKVSMKEVIKKRVAAVDKLVAAGAKLKFVNAGGTGSLELSSKDPSVTELTAGSGLYGPAIFDEFANFQPYPAVGFAIPVTRQPEPGIYTCHGGGYVASGPAGNDKVPKIHWPHQAELLELEGVGEVQTPIRSEEPLSIGDPVVFRHAKSGELFERFNSVKLLRKGKISGEVNTYRGDGQCFV